MNTHGTDGHSLTVVLPKAMTACPKPRVEDAPGLVWRFRRNRWVAYWQARSDLVKRGYAPGAMRLWEGKELNEAGASKLAAQCRKHQAVMLTWGRTSSNHEKPVRYPRFNPPH